MTTLQLEQRWKSIIQTGVSPYRSLIIDSNCIPELYIALDLKGNRFLILQVPERIKVECSTIKLENLSIEWHEGTRFILIGLLNIRFADLYNDLTISLYNRIKDVTTPEVYTTEFISSFHKWAEFFDDVQINRLSESEVKGCFGELIMLNWFLDNITTIETDEILKAWQGPYQRPQDFIFPNHNVEVKTKNIEEVNIQISSEFQLQEEIGKGLRLGVVDVRLTDDGITIQELINSVKTKILTKEGDLSIFLKALGKARLVGTNLDQYESYKWQPLTITIYECTTNGFPKLVHSNLQTGLSNLKYNLNTSVLNTFLTETIIL